MLIPYESRKQFLPHFNEHKGGIYFVYSGFEVIYIGLTWNFYARLNLHSRHKDFVEHKADAIKVVVLKDIFSNKLKLLNAERTLIKKYQPRLNLVCTDKYRRPDAEFKA